jgi:Amt family ammonium transporter
MTFAIITPALVVGAFAERVKFSGMLIFSLLWLLIVYVPLAHWVWGDGWLQKMGLMDFAGGTVVHANAGMAALVCAIVLGRRRGFPDTAMPPHNMTMVVAGACMLWVGWFGFNAGSAIRAGADAGMTMLATHLAAATATLVWIAIEWISFGKPSLVGAVTGTIAGLATITPASGYVGPAAAVLLGLVGGVVCYLAVHLVKRVIVLDDALDVLGVHGVGGATGTLLLPFVITLGAGGTPELMHGTQWQQFGIQVLGVVSVAAWSAFASFVIIKIAKFTSGLRVAREEEIQGLDFASHGETGYNLNA